ncbi:MAG TPA: hypothetical protein VNB49_10495 [Candidatus Dormibacteraeota bacterium]|nr:hypothetical protein [Candidatus Dormibacteraeota bacterium]
MTRIRFERDADQYLGQYTTQTERRDWYVLDTDSMIPDDWRYIGRSCKYSYTYPGHKEVIWIITPVAIKDVPEIPQFHACYGETDEDIIGQIHMFFTSYGQITLTFLGIARERDTWTRQLETETQS